MLASCCEDYLHISAAATTCFFQLSFSCRRPYGPYSSGSWKAEDLYRNFKCVSKHRFKQSSSAVPAHFMAFIAFMAFMLLFIAFIAGAASSPAAFFIDFFIAFMAFMAFIAFIAFMGAIACRQRWAQVGNCNWRTRYEIAWGLHIRHWKLHESFIRSQGKPWPKPCDDQI